MKTTSKIIALLLGAAGLSWSSLSLASSYQVRVPLNPVVATSSGTSPGSSGGASGLVYNPNAANLSGSGLDFGPIATGKVCGSSTQSCADAAFTNEASTAVTVSALTQPSAPFNATASESNAPVCSVGLSLNPGQSCYVGVGYSASALGNQSSAVVVQGSDGSSASAPLAMDVVAANNGLYLASGTASYTFRTLPVGAKLTSSSVTLEDGTSDTIASVAISGSPEFSLDSGSSCSAGTSVSSTAGCSVAVDFAPTAGGNATATVVVTSTSGSTLSLSYSANAVTGVLAEATFEVVNCADPTSSYAQHSTGYFFNLDDKQGTSSWGGSTTQQLMAVNNYGYTNNTSFLFQTNETTGNLYAQALYTDGGAYSLPYIQPALSTNGMSSSVYNSTSVTTDGLTLNGPLVFQASLGDYINGLSLTIPQGTPVNVTSQAVSLGAQAACTGNEGQSIGASSAAAGNTMDANLSVVSAYSVTTCVNWAYQASGFTDQWSDTSGWVGTPVAGPCN